MKFKSSASGDFGDGKFTLATGIPAVVLFDHAPTAWARCLECGVVPRNGGAGVVLGLFHHVAREGSDVLHEGLTRQLAFFNLAQLELPFPGQGRLGEGLNVEPPQQGHQLEGLGRGQEFTRLSNQVLL